MSPLKKENLFKIKILFLIVLAVIIYSNTFSSPFQFDDTSFVVNNHAIRDVSDIKSIWNAVLSQPSRFVCMYSFAVNYHFNKLNPAAYRLTNILIHIVNSFLVWWFAALVFFAETRRNLKSDDRNPNLSKLVPFFAALIFLVHPVQTQAVTYISQRFESLAAMFYLFSLCFYIKARLSVRDSSRIIYYIATCVSMILGMFTKEVVITLPFMLLLVEKIFFTDNENKSSRIARARNILILMFVLIIPAIFSFKVKSILFTPRMSESHPGDILTFPTYFLTQFRVFVKLLSLLFLPVNQNLYYDFPMSPYFFEPATFFSFLFLSLLLFVAIKIKPNNKIVAFSIFWFFITLSVNFIPRVYVIFEHKLYLASVGFVLAISFGLGMLVKDSKRYTAIILCIVFIFCFLTYKRNNVWKNEFSLWEDVLRKSPNIAAPYDNLGYFYTRDKNYEKAIGYFNKALDIYPTANIYNNRGMAYGLSGRYELAMKDFNKALDYQDNLALAYNNRATIYFVYGKYDLALEDFNKAIELDNNYGAAYQKRGDSYREKGDVENALLDYNKAIALDNNTPEIFINRGEIYLNKGQDEQAMLDFNKAIEINPDIAESYGNRGILFKKQKKYNLALKDFEKFISLNPDNAMIYMHEGILFGEHGLYDLALNSFNKSIEIDPNYGACYYNRSLIYKVQGHKEKEKEDLMKAEALGYSIKNNPIKPQ